MLIKILLIAASVGLFVLCGLMIAFIGVIVFWMGYEITHPIEDTGDDAKVINLDEHKNALS